MGKKRSREIKELLDMAEGVFSANIIMMSRVLEDGNVSDEIKEEIMFAQEVNIKMIQALCSTGFNHYGIKEDKDDGVMVH